MYLLIGIVAFGLKILLGAVMVGAIALPFYLTYKVFALIPDGKVLTPVKVYVRAGVIGCLILFGIMFLVFNLGKMIMFVNNIDAYIPPWLQFWHQATG